LEEIFYEVLVCSDTNVLRMLLS